MITTVTNDRCQTLYGTSNQIKPINKNIGNGSQFVEQDTSKVFLFDEENLRWLEFSDINILSLIMRGLM